MINLKNVFKNFKLIVLLSFILVSTYSIVFSMFFSGMRGVIVTEINSTSKCANLKIGSLITQMEGTQISDIQKFNQFVSNSKVGQYISMIVDSGPANCVVVGDGDIGVKVKNVATKSLGFGTDLIGGTVYIFKPTGVIDEDILNKIVGIIEKRIKFSGFQQTKVYKDGKFIKIDSSKDIDLGSLTMGGKIEAKILQDVDIKNDTGKIRIGSESFLIVFKENKFSINNKDYGLKEIFEINNISFSIINFTKNLALVETNIFSNEDINETKNLYGVVEKVGDFYRFSIPIELDTTTSFKFSQITRGLSVSRQPGRESVLNGKIIFYVDDEPITFPLDIPLKLAGKPINVIIGFEKTEDGTYAKMKKVQSIMLFGRLPDKLSKVGEEPFKASINTTDMGLVLIIPVLVSLGLTFSNRFRHKKTMLGVHAVLLAASGAFCTLGFLALLQKYSSYHLILDFPMLIGIIVSFIFALAKFFISVEEKYKGVHFSIKRGYKKIMTINNFLNAVLIIISILAYFLEIGNMGFATIIYLLIEVTLLRMIYNDSLKKFFG